MAEHPSRRWLVYAEALGLLALYLLSFGVLYQVVAARVPGTWTASLAGEAATLAAAAGIVYLLNRAAAHRRGLAAPAREDDRPIGPALAALFLLGSIALLVRILAPGFDDVEFARYGLGDAANFRRFLWTLPLGVATEEIVFRACQDRLRRALGAPASVAATAMAFALYHLAPGHPVGRHEGIALAATMVGGLVLAWLYERTGGIGILLAVHLGYDFLAVTQGQLHVDRRSAAEGALWAVWLLGSAALAVGLWRPRGILGRASGGDLPEIAPAPLRWRIAGGVVFGLAVPLVLRQIRALL